MCVCVCVGGGGGGGGGALVSVKFISHVMCYFCCCWSGSWRMTWKRFPHYWPFVRGIHCPSMVSLYKRPAKRSFNDFFVLSLNKLLNTTPSNRRWFETPWPPWLNYVPRKMPDVRSRYTLYTNMRRFIYCMLYLMYECSAAFTIRSVSLPLITPFSHDSLTKIRPLPLISVRLLFILYCYNLQTQCISLVLKFQTTS